MGITDKLVARLDSGKAFKFSEIDYFAQQKNWVSTGSPALDYRLRTHGYPTGIVEIRGDSQSGKTTLALHALKACVNTYKERAVAAILSSERRDNRELAQMIGVPIDDVIIVPTRTIEKVFSEMGRIIEEANALFEEQNLGKPRFFFVWDSLGQTVSRQEQETITARRDAKTKADEDKNPAMASAARAISFGLRGVLSLLDDNDITFFIINRGYETIGDHITTTKSYGGKAMEFLPCMRLELSKRTGLTVGADKDAEEVGQETQVKVIKSDFGKPKAKYMTEIGYGYGLVFSKDDIDLGIKLGVFQKHGQFGAKFNEKLKWMSRRELYQHYEDHNPMLKVAMIKLTNMVHNLVTQERQQRLER